MTNERVHHSTYYHKRFEGFLEKLVEDEAGRPRIVRTYVADWHLQAVPPAERLRLKLLHAALFSAAAVAFLFAASRPVAGNLAPVTQLLSCAGVLLLTPLLVVLIHYAAAPERMTIWQRYAGPTRLRVLSGLAAIATGGAGVSFLSSSLQGRFASWEMTGLSGGAGGSFALMPPMAPMAPMALTAAAYAASALLLFTMYRLETSVPYRTETSADAGVKDGFAIES